VFAFRRSVTAAALPQPPLRHDRSLGQVACRVLIAVYEQRAEGEEGPPQLTAEQVVAPIEPYFEVQRLEQRQFTGSGGQPTHLAWKAILRRRSHNQTPSG